jgi:hypothetical protein
MANTIMSPPPMIPPAPARMNILEETGTTFREWQYGQERMGRIVFS